MPSFEEQQEYTRPMAINKPKSSHRSSVGSLDDGTGSGSETEHSSVEKKSSSSSSSGVSSIASSPTALNSGNGASLPTIGGDPTEFMPYEQIAAQLGILSILDQPDGDRKTITMTDEEPTPTFPTFVPRSYHSDSGASSAGCDYQSLDDHGQSPPVFGQMQGGGFMPYAGAQFAPAVGYGNQNGNGGQSMGLAEYVDFPGAYDEGMPIRVGGVNVTETVPVPSSEHVAEIVGRQGCKIKALRAKTNTYIKTPVRGEEPCFVVTGRRADVEAAKLEIVNAADHFTQIRASRRHSQGGMPAPGHITAYVRVPYRVVGLVVGPKGATIKRIQQDTHTYIITPSRDREPVFEVTGMPDNVEKARKEIEVHIYMRTGNLPVTNGYDASHYVATNQQAGQEPGGPINGAQPQVQGGPNAPGAPVADGWGNFQTNSGSIGMGANVDFHLNGNDVQYDGDMNQMSTGVISKPSTTGAFSSGGSFGAWGEPVASVVLGQSGMVSQRAGQYPTWSTAGLVAVDRPAAPFGFDKMETLEKLILSATNGRRNLMTTPSPNKRSTPVGRVH